MLFSEDTSPEAERVLVGLLRARPPAERLSSVFHLNALARSLTFAGLRDRNPGASNDEIEVLYAGMDLGRQLAARVLDAWRARGIAAGARV